MSFSKKVLIAFITLININILYTQPILSGTPDSLIEGAHLVILQEDYNFTISALNESITDYKVEYVVLKKSDYVPEYLSVMYDKYTGIKKAKVEIFDKNNKRIKKIKLGKFKKKSFIDYNTTSDDSGIKYATISDITPPYKVVFTYRTIRKGNNAFFPVWQAAGNEFQSVKSSKFKVVDEVGDNLLYKCINIAPPKIKKDKNITEYKWEIKNFKYIKFESFNKRIYDYFPMVLLASKRFEVEDFEGGMQDWRSIGSFINLMLKNRNDFTAKQQKEIKNLVKKGDSDYEKIKKLYRYLQNSTRYVSIQLGIGGWQPFNTSFVHKNKYGDCKALTFYMKSMLEVVGIPSYYTLVKSGTNADEIFSDFPFMRFNHSFLCVPVREDTIWLECTSQFSPFGYTGTFTDDRNVLVVNENGGNLVRSKVYSPGENQKTTQVDIHLSPDFDSAFVDIKVSLTGLAIEDNYYLEYVLLNKDKQKKWLEDIINLDNFSIEDFKINPVEGDIVPTGSYSAKILSKKMFIKAGNNLLFKPFVFNPPDMQSITENTSKHDIFIRRSYILEDTIAVTIPDGYQYKNRNGKFDLKKKFGEYSIDVVPKNDRIIFIRRLKILKGDFPPSDFDEFKKFVNTINRKDNKRYIFEKKKDVD